MRYLVRALLASCTSSVPLRWSHLSGSSPGSVIIVFLSLTVSCPASITGRIPPDQGAPNKGARQGSPDRAPRTGLPGQGSPDRAPRTGLPRQTERWGWDKVNCLGPTQILIDNRCVRPTKHPLGSHYIGTCIKSLCTDYILMNNKYLL